MSQTYTANCYQSDHVAVTDMANIEANFATLRSSNSGSSAPANTEAGLQWWDTVNNVLKIRNDANSAWLAILQGDVSQKIWVYRNSTCDGWTIDGDVKDRVLALKGAGGLYNVAGGTPEGATWAVLKAHTHTGGAHTHAHGNHVHQIYSLSGSGDSHSYYNSSVVLTTCGSASWSSGTNLGMAHESGDKKMNAAMYTNATITVAGTTGSRTAPAGGAQSTADVRPQAAVGTLQYPDM